MISVTDSRLDVTPAVDFNLPPVPARRSRELIVLAIELLPTVLDDIEADVIEELALELAQADDAIQINNAVIASAMGIAHDQAQEIQRLRGRLRHVHEELRTTRPTP